MQDADRVEPKPPTELDEHDRELIRYMLSLTPGERLRYIQSFANGVEKLKHARRV